MQKRALIVDDQEIYRKSLKTILRIRGFDSDEATDGLKALNCLGQTASYDVVFSDVSMPNMNGFELLARIKRSPKIKHIPVIMLTSENKPEDIEKGNKLGCSYYMIKPFNSQKLDEALTAAGLK